jgi:cell division protein FtsB
MSKPMDTLNEQMNTLVESQAQEIKELKEEIEKLKQEVAQKKDAWDGKKVCEDLIENTNYTPETSFIEYIQKLEKDNKGQGWDRLRLHKEIAKLKKDYEEMVEEKCKYESSFLDLDTENGKLKQELVDTANQLEIATGFCESHINELLLEDVKEVFDGQIQVHEPKSWFSDFMRPHAYKFLDVVIKKLTTHFNGDSPYTQFHNGFWYNDGDKYTLHHNGTGAISITGVTSSDEEDEED